MVKHRAKSQQRQVLKTEEVNHKETLGLADKIFWNSNPSKISLILL